MNLGQMLRNIKSLRNNIKNITMKNIMTIKRLLFVITLQLFAFIAVSQNSAMFNYQAVVRDNLGNPMADEAVEIDVRILQGTADGTEVFAEMHDVQTNSFGLVTLQIGDIEDLSVIDWSADIYFFEVTINGTLMGTSQLLSVPMAVSATYAENYEEIDPMFVTSPAGMITDSEISNWNAAYEWGDHTGMYLPADYTPEFNEIDPIFTASPAGTITSDNIIDWTTAYSWGDHSGQYLPIDYEETDPIYSNAPASTIANADIAHWNETYSWGNHSGLYLPSDYSEADPQYLASPAGTIVNADILNWNEAHTWGDHSGLYLPADYTPDMTGVVNTTGNQNVAGTKTFTSAVNVPTPVSASNAVPKEYVDALLERIDALELAVGIKIQDWEGNVYNTVTIGSQVWMAENLKAMRYNDGTLIDYVTNDGVWSTTTNGAWTTANHDFFTYHDVYGHLYNWYAVNSGNLCPVGWHVPTDAEWDELETYLINGGYGYGGSGNDISKSLAATELWISSSTPGNTGNDIGSNNSSGFSALPGSFMYGNGVTNTPGSEGYFWTSDEFSTSQGYYRSLNTNLSTLNSSIGQKITGLSVRCIKD